NSPPEPGIMAASSAVHSAPIRLSSPATNQQAKIIHSEPNCSAMGVIFLNTPEPTIALTTSKIADVRVTFRFRVVAVGSMLFQGLGEVRADASDADVGKRFATSLFVARRDPYNGFAVRQK